MNVRLRIWKSGRVTAEHELTECGQRTGIWMDIGTYNTVKGANIAITKFVKKMGTYANYYSTIYSQF